MSPYQAMRQRAMQRHLEGENPVNIYSDLGRSKKWFFKWLARYQAAPASFWYCDHSRARKTSSRVLSPQGEQLIIKVRQELEARKYQQTGSCTIQWHLRRLGIDPLPKIWQIDRTLRRYQLTKPKGPYQSKHKSYPALEAERPGLVQQIDFTPAHHLKGCGVARSLNAIDICSGRPKINICRTRRSEEAINSLLAAWQEMGIPTYLQMDNDPSFAGHNLCPRSLSPLLVFLLRLRVEAVFIPPYEPWRNSIVERFNDNYKHQFFASQRWPNLEHLQQEAREYELFFYRNHVYSTRGGKTPWEIEQEHSFRPELLPRNFTSEDAGSIKIEGGRIHFIRFIRSDGILKVLGEGFKVDDAFTYEYVTATIDIKEQCLEVKLKGQILQKFHYRINLKELG